MNAGLPWTDESRMEVVSRFRSGTSIDELSKYLGRTKGSIVSELAKQGLIESSEKADYR
jgi:hypothetical protein